MKKVLKRLFAFIVVLSLVGCARESKTAKNYANVDKPVGFNFEAFDTQCSISLYGTFDQTTLDTIGEDLQNMVSAYEDTLSRTKVGSDIYNINHRTSDSVMITDMTASIFQLGQDFYKWSDGKFDISSGTLIELWDVKNRKTVPTLEEINEARKHCGNFSYTIERDVEPEMIKCNRITFTGDRKTVYDVGALGKGYCCDSLKNMIEENELIEAALINLGGNVCTVGKLATRKNGAFNVGIFKPFSGNEIAETVKVVDKNVITSGNYQRYFTVPGDDRIYHHIIDPSTGYPTDNGLNSVTIVSINGLLGDYLSTACMLMGEEDSKALIDFCQKNFNDKNIQAIYIDENDNVTKYPKKVKTY